jgi:hypothetical protein
MTAHLCLRSSHFWKRQIMIMSDMSYNRKNWSTQGSQSEAGMLAKTFLSLCVERKSADICSTDCTTELVRYCIGFEFILWGSVASRSLSLAVPQTRIKACDRLFLSRLCFAPGYSASCPSVIIFFNFFKMYLFVSEFVWPRASNAMSDHA